MLRRIHEPSNGEAHKAPQSRMGSVVEELCKKGVLTNQQVLEIMPRLTKNSKPDQLIEALTELGIIEPTEPLNEDVEDFIQELGAMDAQNLADFILDLRNDKKGLKDMTPVPVKSYFPAAYIAVIGGLILFAVILSPQIQSALDQVITHKSPEGSGFKMPFFGFLNYLVSLFI